MPRSPKSPAATLFGRRLREARTRIGIAQDRLGVSIGLDEGASSARMSRYETGEHQAPLAIAERLAQALGVPLPYFYCDDDRLAAVILRYGQADETGRARLAALAEGLAGEPHRPSASSRHPGFASIPFSYKKNNNRRRLGLPKGRRFGAPLLLFFFIFNNN